MENILVCIILVATLLVVIRVLLATRDIPVNHEATLKLLAKMKGRRALCLCLKHAKVLRPKLFFPAMPRDCDACKERI